MQLLLTGALVPHAPVLLPQVNGAGGAAIRTAAAALDLSEPEVLIFVSPHGAGDRVYARAEGDLSGFGVSGVEVRTEVDAPLAQRLAQRWDRPLSDDGLDHGILVPAALLRPEKQIVAVAIGERGDEVAAAVEAGASLARAIGEESAERSIAVIVSAHGSAALSARAPLTDRPEGHRLQEAIVEAATTDLSTLLEIPEGLWEQGGSCSAGAFATLASLFPGRTLDISAQDAPFGVGYIVGRVQ